MDPRKYEVVHKIGVRDYIKLNSDKKISDIGRQGESLPL